MSDILMTLTPSPVRTAASALIQGALGVLLLWIALAHPSGDAGWRVFLEVLGGLALWNTLSVWRAGGRRLELTETELRDTGGDQLCRIDEIDQVARGVFAIKPARGFALILKEPKARRTVPGLWWRFGRRVGVGGATSPGDNRIMAEIIDAMIAERRG